MNVCLRWWSVSLATTFFLVTPALAQAIKDPIKDYLSSRDTNRDPDLPFLEELYVLKCDLDVSGKTYTLISFNAEGGRQGNYWTVYKQIKDGWAKVDDAETTLTFRRDTFYVGVVRGKYGLLAYAPGRRGGDLNFFQIVNGKVAKAKIASVDLSNPSDNHEMAKYFGSAPDWRGPKTHPIEKMSLGDLRNAGYDVDSDIKAAEAADHLQQPLSK
jgi:hypothetical protein